MDLEIGGGAEAAAATGAAAGVPAEGETGFEKMTRDREAGIVGICGLPDFLEPLGDTMSMNDLKEDTRRIMPEETNPEGRVFRRKGTHEVL